MKLCNKEFDNHPAFHANFEDVYIYKANGNNYFVCRTPQNDVELQREWIFYGTKETVNGWLYGCVQARHKFVTARAEILL